MDYQSYGTRTEARETARKMQGTGWPEACVMRFVAFGDSDEPGGTPTHTFWVVRASKQPERYLRVDGFVR